MTRVIIIGAGKGGGALIEILSKDRFVKIVGIADIDPEAPGMDLARSLKIEATIDYRKLLQNRPDIIIDVTGNLALHKDLERLPKSIEIMGGLSAKFMWQLIEERIKSQAMAEVIQRKYSFENMIGEDEKLKEIKRLLPRIAKTNSTVLIEGESGTGKEMIAHAIHQLSLRDDKPFVCVNCGALVEGLLESELFGHVRGAFTGAVAHRVGRFELAHGGTLFLDEISEISPGMQVKLLRVIQEGEFERVGDSRRIKVDVRIISATNRDLKKAVEMGAFRQDLYYRLRVVPVPLPPLRARKGDVPFLVNHLISRFNKEMFRKVIHVAPEAMAILMAYDYPGNIRELANIIEHAMVFCTDETLHAKHLETHIQPIPQSTLQHVMEQDHPLAAAEREIIAHVLAQSGYNYLRAAKRLKMSRTTLWRKIKTYGLDRPQS